MDEDDGEDDEEEEEVVEEVFDDVEFFDAEFAAVEEVEDVHEDEGVEHDRVDVVFVFDLVVLIEISNIDKVMFITKDPWSK